MFFYLYMLLFRFYSTRTNIYKGFFLYVFYLYIIISLYVLHNNYISTLYYYDGGVVCLFVSSYFPQGPLSPVPLRTVADIQHAKSRTKWARPSVGKTNLLPVSRATRRTYA